MRRGVGIWQAIMIMLVVSGIMIVTLKYARIGAQHTVDTYVKEQAELFLQSAIEVAMLEISGFDRSGGECLETLRVTSPDQRFFADVNISRYYLFNGRNDDGNLLGLCNSQIVAVDTAESHGMVVLEVAVTSNDAHPKAPEHPVRILRRSLQRP